MKKVIIILFCFLTSIVHAADLYIATDGTDSGDCTGSDCLTLQYAMGQMSQSDTLIIRDGTYSGADNVLDASNSPPNGTAEAYTIIKAENDGAAIFDGEYTREMFLIRAAGASYIQLEGLYIIKSSESLIEISNATAVHHIKILRCGGYDAGQFNATIAMDYNAFNIGVANHILIEDCYLFGNYRYGFVAGLSAEQIIFRRCVARIDTSNTITGISAFLAYDPRQVEFQNCIAIDIDAGDEYYLENDSETEPRGFMFRDTASGYDSSDIYLRGCIVLNNDSGLAVIGAGGTPSVSIIDSVFWHTEYGSHFRGGGVSIDHSTIGNVFGVADNWEAHAIHIETGSDPVTNTIIYDVDNEQAARGNGAYSAGDYNALYANPAGNFEDWEDGDNTLCSENSNAVDPLDGSLEYLIRIEDSSALDGAGSTGDIGATVFYQIGLSGTHYGDANYNTTTGTDLWPFPNEDLIKTKMASYTYDDGGGGDPEITGARGFCTGISIGGDPQTLTTYIWEYLGNEIPGDIYGSGSSTITTNASGTFTIK